MPIPRVFPLKVLPDTPCRILLSVWTLIVLTHCASPPDPQQPDDAPGRPTALATAPERPSILLITLDTTRADALTSDRVETPTFDRLRARGRWFSQAYTTAPTTLPAHASMLTGLLPIEHGIHENARYLSMQHPLLAERLKAVGYRTAGFISGYPLARTFGLARGFDHYDDELQGAPERRAGDTTSRVLDWLEQQNASTPIFLWVHFFDPHAPYDPPAPFDAIYADAPYLGEIAYLDQEVGRLLAAWDRSRPESAILAAGDHGEGLGEHGESQHGYLLYQSTMRVPLLLAGSGLDTGETEHPVSIRQIFDTVLVLAGEDGPAHLLGEPPRRILGEAMKPYFQYGWQPQVMVVEDGLKWIRTDGDEIYDVVDDPGETTNLAGERDIPREARQRVRAYFDRLLTGDTSAVPAALSQDDRERLASLGYTGGSSEPGPLRDEAPAARDRTHLFPILDAGSDAFVRRDYETAIQIFTGVLEEDPHNPTAALRLAVAHSALGRDALALESFKRAREIAPNSVDVRHYHGLHELRSGRLDAATTLLESVLADSPERRTTLEALLEIRQRQGDLPRAIPLAERLVEQRPNDVDLRLDLAQMRMAIGETLGAIEAFEGARAMQDDAFAHDLELGVLHLANRDFETARVHLDQVESGHPAYDMALFKRAQVSVLLGELDAPDRVRRAYAHGSPDVRALIERDSLFQGLSWR